MRRVIDVMFASIVILAALPLWVAIAIVLRFTGEGKVFYFQERVGFEGKLFRLAKFVTMLEDSPNLGSGDITLQNDSRVLPFGRILRNTKLNEIAQVINLLKGDMTLVGPRPLTPGNFNCYPDLVQREIVKVKPGLTGLGSIVFTDEESIIANSRKEPLDCYRDEIAAYKGELEMWYISHRSMWLDFKIVLLTVWVLLFRGSTLYEKVLKGLPSRST
jgi:lipopolysaccharide/colanic/teichoic acid biosynthesis glycosyltransferase